LLKFLPIEDAVRKDAQGYLDQAAEQRSAPNWRLHAIGIRTNPSEQGIHEVAPQIDEIEQAKTDPRFANIRIPDYAGVASVFRL
jgi:hypothetical protein